MPQHVFTDDNNLVGLYRFATYVEDGQLLNLSDSPVYTGLNSFQVSGTPTRDSNIPSEAPSGSGVKFDNGSDVFHLNVVSGNASGFEVSNSSDFSYGFFGRPGVMHDFSRAWFTKHTSATSGSFFRIQATSGAINILNWEMSIPRSNGGSNLIISSPHTIDTGNYESVIAVVNNTANTAILYVSGIPVASSTSANMSTGPSGWSQSPVRIGSQRSFSSQGNTNSIGFESGLMAEAFFMDRILTQDEIDGIAQSGFILNPSATPSFNPSDDSNANDTQKDNVGAINTTAADLKVTEWNATNSANPSGMRHTESGSHPSFVRIIGVGSGIVFNGAKFNSISDPVALTVRNVTSGKFVSNMKIWLQDDSAFVGVDGYEISARIKSEWEPNLNMSSGGGVLPRNQLAASSVLRSDLTNSISGVVAQSNATSGEPDVSQYIYLALDTNGNFIPGTYGPTNFNIRITTDFSDV